MQLHTVVHVKCCSLLSPPILTRVVCLGGGTLCNGTHTVVHVKCCLLSSPPIFTRGVEEAAPYAAACTHVTLVHTAETAHTHMLRSYKLLKQHARMLRLYTHATLTLTAAAHSHSTFTCPHIRRLVGGQAARAGMHAHILSTSACKKHAYMLC